MLYARFLRQYTPKLSISASNAFWFCSWLTSLHLNSYPVVESWAEDLIQPWVGNSRNIIIVIPLSSIAVINSHICSPIIQLEFCCQQRLRYSWSSPPLQALGTVNQFELWRRSRRSRKKTWLHHQLSHKRSWIPIRELLGDGLKGGFMGSKTDQLNVLYTTTVNDDFTTNTGSLPLEIRTYEWERKS